MTAWVAVALCMGATLSVGLYGNHYPYYYHWDENGKAVQVLEGTRNRHHPLLMLETVRRLHAAAERPPSRQNVTELGRSGSACCAAVAVGALAVCVGLCATPAAGVLAGLFAATNLHLLTAAHIFKEDAWLAGAWCLALCAAAWFERRPSLPRAALLGLAVGLAASAKYVGALLLPGSLLVAVLTPAGDGARGTGRRQAGTAALVLAACLLAFGVINFGDRVELSRAVHALADEIREQYHNDTGFSRLGDRFRPAGSGVAVVLAVAGLWLSRRNQPRTVWLLCGSAVALALVLATTTRFVTRYLLPISLSLDAAAALGIRALCAAPGFGGRLSRRGRVALAGALALGVLLPGAPLWLRTLRGYGAPDQHVAVVQFLNKAMKAGESVACDLRSLLPDPATGRIPGLAGDAWQIPKWDESDKPILSAVRARGIRFVVLNDRYASFYRSGRFEKPEGQFSDFAVRRRFYEALESQASVRLRLPVGDMTLLQPGFTVYELGAVRMEPR